MTDSRESLPSYPPSAYTETADNNSRMKLYEERERDFIEFVEEIPKPMDTDNEPDDHPLSGLQCLLALTEILEKAAQLRHTNFDLEQRIDVLQRLKQIAEVQSDLHNAKLDINANGIPRGRKAKASDELDGSRLKRTLSAESINTFHTPIGRFDQSDDFNKHRATHGKGSRLSETWGKVKDKLAHKDPLHTPLTSKPTRRHRSSTDQSGPLRHSISAEAPIFSLNCGAGQFTQREINISPPATDDFGGVWLGDDTGDGSTNTSEFGGVWLGPPSTSIQVQEVSLLGEVNKTDCNNKIAMKETNRQELERQSSDPVIRRPPTQATASASWSRVRSTSNDESQDWVAKTISRDNHSPPPLRKKSSKPKLLALLPGSEQKRTKKAGQSDELPKEFRKKIEEWHTLKESVSTAVSTPVTSEVPAKTSKAAKPKNQRFKNKKKSGLLKQRSKSAERVEDNPVGRQHSDDFEEKLREWSVKQGYHPTYYSEIRNSRGSSDSVSEVSSTRESRHKVDNTRMADGVSDQSLTFNTQVSSCTDSNSSFSPSTAVHFHSAENLQTLYEISQSADVVFHRDPSSNAQTSRKLSRSEEAINSSAATATLLETQIDQSASATSSHVDLYARASDHSLEKHLSLFHVTSETSIHEDTEMSSHDDVITCSSSSLSRPDERSLNVSSTISTCTLSSNSADLELSPSKEVVLEHSPVISNTPSTEDINEEFELNLEDCKQSVIEEMSINDSKECECDESDTEPGSREELETDSGVTQSAEVDKPNGWTDNTLDLHFSEVEEESSNILDSSVELSLQSKPDDKVHQTNESSSAEDCSYDINSNVTDNCNDEESIPSPTTDPVLHLSTEVPLKARLKSLALEYESEDCNRQKSTAQYLKNAENSSKKPRPDIYTHSAVQSPIQPLYPSSSHLLLNTSNKLGTSVNSSISYGIERTQAKTVQTGAIVNNRFNHLTKPLHTNIHRLKSADELIYEQSSQPAAKVYTRNASVGSLNLPKLEIRNRREMHEKPKEGTVKKALSMFIDGGTFNAQFGTDFARPPRSQPT